MYKTRQIIDEYKKEFPEFQYYHSIIDKIEENVEKMPDICIESCKALFEGVSKTILNNIGVVISKDDSPSALLRKALRGISKYSKIEESFIQANCGFVHRMSELRNERGDISHGKAVPKEYNSDKYVSEMIMSITDSTISYLLNIYLKLGLTESDVINYDDNQEFNDYLDSKYDLEGILYSQAFFDQDPAGYRARLEDFLSSENEEENI